MTGRILLVSANPGLVAEVEETFTKADYEVFVARDNLEAILFLDREQCDVALLEVQNQGAEGFAFCRVLRRSWDAAVVLLLHPTAQRDILLGYQMGADAYVMLPLDNRLLLARVEALVRRAQITRAHTAAEPAQARPQLVRAVIQRK